MMKKGIILCVLLIFMCSCLPREKSIRLQYNYKEGDVLKYKVSTISKGTITMNGLPTEGTPTPPMGVETKRECIFTQKLIGIEAGGVANIEISYDSFKQNIKIGNEIFLPGEENPFLNFIEGKKINVRIGKDGYLLEINGIEEISEQILAQMPEKIPDEFIHKFKAEFEKNMLMTIEGNYQRFPLEEMKVGDMWIRESDYNIPFWGTAHGKFTYTIEKFNKVNGLEYVQIGIDTILNFSETEPTLLFSEQLNMPPLKFNGDAQGKGKMFFAYQEGKLITTDLRMKMQISYSEQEEMPLKVKMNFDTQTIIKLQ